MKIAFDGHLLLKGNKTGIAWNAHNLILELAKFPENECIIQYFKTPSVKELDVYKRAGCRLEGCSWFGYPVYKLLWAIAPVPYRIFFRTVPDITQFFNFTVPPGVRGKRIVFIHDMAYQAWPHTVDKKTRIWLELSMKKSCRHADHIVTVSEFSKKEIIRYLGVPKERITVIPNAVDPAVYHTGYSKKQICSVRNRLGIQEEYFLYLGTIEPRKNLDRLLDAYARLCRQKKHVPQLVLAGGKGWLCEGIYAKARRLHLGSRILFTGYVSQEDSPLLMCGAKAFLFPSLYEGFGMPVLEAMACGTPVITSNTSALAELAQGAGLMADPMSVQSVYRAMKLLLEDDAYREALRMRGLQRAGAYSWADAAVRLMHVYRELLKE